MNCNFETLSKYGVFAGRARRKEYWMFQLWHSIILVALIVIDVRLSASGHKERAVLTGLYPLAAALPALATYVRRLHDADHNGSWFFMGAIPNADSLGVAPSEVGYIPPPLGPNGR